VFVQLGGPRLVVAGDDAAALDRLTERHRRLAGGIVPSVAERGEGFVALACRGVVDLETLLGRFEASRARCPYAQGITLVEGLMDVLVRAEAAGLALGALAPSQIVVDADGAVALVLLEASSATPGVAIAPEVAAGGPPTPSGDLYAVTLLLRALIGFVDFPPAATRVLQGRPEPEDRELAQLMGWSNLAILAAFPDRRPSASEATSVMRRVWSLLDARPEREGFARFLAGAIAAEAAPALAVDAAAATVTIAGTRHELGARRAVWRVLLALAEHHAAGATGSLDAARLFAAGWPGEVCAAGSAADRVYVALSALRKLGLDELIERHDGGWRLDPRARVAITRSRDPG
jgi:hypothetical protein